jgi:hypothetical protein
VASPEGLSPADITDLDGTPRRTDHGREQQGGQDAVGHAGLPNGS